MTVIAIRGVDVDLRYVILNCIWDVALIFVWFAVIVTTKRLLSRLRRHDKSPEVYESHLTRWAHIFVIAILCTLYGIDTMNVFFDEILYLNVILMQEYCIVGTSWVIYYLLSHVQTYLLLHSVVRLPDGLLALRRYWMRFVLIVGNILVIVVATLQRAFLEGLVFQFLAIQQMILGPVLAIVVFTVSREWKALYAEASPRSGKLEEATRSFQRFGYISAGFIMFFGAALTYFYAQDFAVSKDLRFQDLPGFGNRNGAHEFSLRNAWPRWFALAALLYLLKLHWIEKRQRISTDRDKTPSDPVAGKKSNSRENEPCDGLQPQAPQISIFTEETRRSSSSRVSLYEFPYHSSSLYTTPPVLSSSMHKIPKIEECTLDTQLYSLRSLPEQDVYETEKLGPSPSSDSLKELNPMCSSEVLLRKSSLNASEIDEQSRCHDQQNLSRKQSASSRSAKEAVGRYKVEHVELSTNSRHSGRMDLDECSLSRSTSSCSDVCPPADGAHIV